MKVMQIKPADVEMSLEAILGLFSAILDDRAHSVLAKAKASLKTSVTEHHARARENRGFPPLRWGFSIHPQDPLGFQITEVNKLCLKVDLFLQSYWDSDPADAPTLLNVGVRIWSLDDHVYFRKEWDAKRLSSEVDSNTGRVMLRLHFDLANEMQSGPKYHLQVGGKPHDGELHWFPESLSVPRMLHPPMDLVLATELIAATFFPENYRDLKREPLWTSSMKTSQSHLLAGYLDTATRAVSEGKSLLDTLWNVQ